MKPALVLFAVLMGGFSSALAQPVMEPFSDGEDGAKIHAASGFVCPRQLAGFTRDAASESDPETQSASCSYSMRDGVYGTVLLTPLKSGYNPKDSLARRFREQEALGGRLVSQGMVKLGEPQLAVYTRIYETGKLESLRYSVLLAGSAVKNWVVESSIEYAEPRDAALKDGFLKAVYETALTRIGQ